MEAAATSDVNEASPTARPMILALDMVRWCTMEDNVGTEECVDCALDVPVDVCMKITEDVCEADVGVLDPLVRVNRSDDERCVDKGNVSDSDMIVGDELDTSEDIAADEDKDNEEVCASDEPEVP
ncbi:hypothetical protein EVJ58_g6911 [Rhodofomes roseus]|uniref:Uncharacterized protein n=1 Tax=Rhodofomes roseus TaxID=34475 RepID=A0A4Y9Y636_9APHY|nr:hypothetical protein EVJ58_g6911 [Rhodofomes roseus]